MRSSSTREAAEAALCMGIDVSGGENWKSDSREEDLLCLIDSFVLEGERGEVMELKNHASFLVIPLEEQPEEELPCITAISDLFMNTSQWRAEFIGKIQDMGKYYVSEESRQNIEQRFSSLVGWAKHLSLSAVWIPSPPQLGTHDFDKSFQNYSRFVGSLCQSNPSITFWMQFSMDSDSWRLWDDLFSSTDYPTNLRIILNVSRNCQISIPELKRWCGEPVVCISFPQDDSNSSFIESDQEFMISQLLKIARYTIIEVCSLNDVESIARTRNSLVSVLENCQGEGNSSYNDFLQTPLQPLKENLDSQTYEVFEQDSVKYSTYKAAIGKALIDLSFNPERGEDSSITVFVVGAGRGPLVTASIEAAEFAGVSDRIKVYAIEKNPHAIMTLKAKNLQAWNRSVSIIDTDIRHWNPTPLIKADLVVSELLGSFGDNELSPECIECVIRLLHPWGVSIPTSYTSYIAPISSSSLWNRTRTLAMNPNHSEAMESMHVVKMTNFYEISVPQSCFTFEHPHRRIDVNSRFEIMEFSAELDSRIFGLAGYFSSDLYQGIELSIVPETHTQSMQSWFPMYIPLKNPISVRAGEKIKLCMWRNVNISEAKVWYEWKVYSANSSSVIHNVNGDMYSISL